MTLVSQREHLSFIEAARQKYKVDEFRVLIEL